MSVIGASERRSGDGSTLRSSKSWQWTDLGALARLEIGWPGPVEYSKSIASPGDEMYYRRK